MPRWIIPTHFEPVTQDTTPLITKWGQDNQVPVRPIVFATALLISAVAPMPVTATIPVPDWGWMSEIQQPVLPLPQGQSAIVQRIKSTSLVPPISKFGWFVETGRPVLAPDSPISAIVTVVDPFLLGLVLDFDWWQPTQEPVRLVPHAIQLHHIGLGVPILPPVPDFLGSQVIVPVYLVPRAQQFTTPYIPTLFLYNTVGGIFLYTDANWSNTVLYFEAYFRSVSGEVVARLYNVTDDTPVADSPVSVVATSLTRVRSTVITLEDGKEYVPQLGALVGHSGIIRSTEIIRIEG